jgi:hypothetical protein
MQDPLASARWIRLDETHKNLHKDTSGAPPRLKIVKIVSKSLD